MTPWEREDLGTGISDVRLLAADVETHTAVLTTYSFYVDCTAFFYYHTDHDNSNRKRTGERARGATGKSRL